MMVPWIAWAASSAGLQVVLLDSTQESADKGKAYSAGLLDKRVKSKRASAADQDCQLGLITATTSYDDRSEEHTSDPQSLMRISYAVFCLKHTNPLHQSVKHYATA